MKTPCTAVLLNWLAIMGDTGTAVFLRCFVWKAGVSTTNVWNASGVKKVYKCRKSSQNVADSGSMTVAVSA